MSTSYDICVARLSYLNLAFLAKAVYFVRYTPLDYALTGEHMEVAQYMVEHGGLSITGIQDIAALKIQVFTLKILSFLFFKKRYFS